MQIRQALCYRNVIPHFVVLCARQISRQTLKFYLQWNGHVYSRELQNWQTSSEAYYAVVLVHSIHSRTARSARKRPLYQREGETERASCEKGVIQLVIRPPLTDEMISECPKLASASCDNWMVMYALNAYTVHHERSRRRWFAVRVSARQRVKCV